MYAVILLPLTKKYSFPIKICNFLWKWIEGLLYIPLHYICSVASWMIIVLFSPSLLFSRLGISLIASLILFFWCPALIVVLWSIFLVISCFQKDRDSSAVPIKKNSKDPYDQAIFEAIYDLRGRIPEVYGLASRFTFRKELPDKSEFNASVEPNSSLGSQILRLFGVQSYIISVHYDYLSPHNFFSENFAVGGASDTLTLRSFLRGVLAHELAHTCHPLFQMYICFAQIILAIRSTFLLNYTFGWLLRVIFNALVNRKIEYMADEMGQVLLNSSPDLLYFMEIFYRDGLDDGFFGICFSDHPKMKDRIEKIHSKFGLMANAF